MTRQELATSIISDREASERYEQLANRATSSRMRAHYRKCMLEAYEAFEKKRQEQAELHLPDDRRW